jgi:hypothetical protein
MSKFEKMNLTPNTVKEVSDAIIAFGGTLNVSYEALTEALDHIAPVVGHFKINKIPLGDAPELIRKGWVDLNLPVRVMNTICENRECVAINSREAIEALINVDGKQDRQGIAIEAHLWWLDYYRKKLVEYGLADPDCNEDELWALAAGSRIDNADFLFFDLDCGEYTSIQSNIATTHASLN